MISRLANNRFRSGTLLQTAALSLFVLTGSACNRRSVHPAIPAPPPAALADYAAAEKSFEAGDYASAARSYETYLGAGIADNRDRAMFRAALAYAFTRAPAESAGQYKTLLQSLVTQFPGSPYAAPANLILNLQTQVETLQGSLNDQQAKVRTLTEELKRLKDIDMHRVPTRPKP